MASQKPVLRSRDYTVAWISLIQKEYLIACAMLDHEHNTPVDISDDDNCYTFGSIGEHNVVLASLPMTRMGVSQAGMLATEMLHTFPKLRFGLMVGIAGGAPTVKNDIRLGDLVVSTPNDQKRVGGVIHYGFGATCQTQGFQRRGHLNSPPEVLLNAMNKLKTIYDRQGHRLELLIQQVIEQHQPSLEGYRQPERETDILYRATFLHPNDNDSCIGWCDTDNSTIVERSERGAGANSPVIHYGTIASADNLMRDAILRDKIAEEDDVLCFEMESAGVMNHDLRFMVIRGICDYSDTHKNDNWQCYAAAVAAIYAKQLLGVVRAERKTRSFNLKSMNIFGESKTDVLDVLSFESMFEKKDFSMPETSYNVDWIWETKFSNWLSTSDRPFWICGKPGSGKSTLMAYLAHSKKTREFLQLDDPTYWVIHFYFDYRAGSKLPNNVLGMYRMMLYQLADRSDQIKARLTKLLEAGRLKLDSQQHLLDVFCEILAECGNPLCIFVDGLDEFEGGMIELVQICQVIMDRMSVKFCLASRPDAQVTEGLNIWSKITMQDLNEASMRMYADWQIMRAAATDSTIAKRFSRSLTNYLIRKAEGILLWFRLVIDEVIELFIAGCPSEEIIDIVQQLPKGLNAVYVRALDSIAPHQRGEAALILHLVVQLRSMSKWTEKGVAPGMEFQANDLDHLWGAYDFIYDQIGHEIEIRRTDSQAEFQVVVRQLLRGLVEFSPIKFYTAMYDLSPESNFGVRFVHETFSTFVDDSRWDQQHLPQAVTEYFSSSFWLGFASKMVEQAGQEHVIQPKIMDQAVQEMNLLLDTGAFDGAQDSFAVETGNTIKLKSISRALGHYVKRPYTILGALHGEFCPLAKAEYASTMLGPSVELPPEWKPRHIILRTIFFVYMDLATMHEESGQSSYPISSGAMQSFLNPIISYCSLMGTRGVVDRRLLRLFQEDQRLKPVRDTYLAIIGNLVHYFHDRVASLSLSEYQRNCLFEAILSHQKAEQGPIVSAARGLLATLADSGRFPKNRDFCFLLRKTMCWQTASDFSLALMSHLAPDPIQTEGLELCCTQGGREIGLLYHWAQVTCLSVCRCNNGPIRPWHDHSLVLQLILVHGTSVHAPCYWGGSVLQALLDSSVQPRSDHGPLDRKAKFLALMENGFDPAIVSDSEDNIGSAKSLLHQLFMSTTERREVEYILRYLQFHQAYDRWPEDEAEALRFSQSGDRANGRPQTSPPTSPPGSSLSNRLFGSNRTDAQTLESNDLYGVGSTDGRSRSRTVENSGTDLTVRDEVVSVVNNVRGLLQISSIEAMSAFDKWKTSINASWKNATD